MKEIYHQNKIVIWGFLALLGIQAMLLLFVVGGKNEHTINQNNTAQIALIEEAVEQARYEGEIVIYHNQLSGCVRGNLLRSVYFNFAEEAAQTRAASAVHTQGEEQTINEEAAAKYHHEAERLANAEFARPDGTIRCKEAIKPPPPLPASPQQSVPSAS